MLNTDLLISTLIDSGGPAARFERREKASGGPSTLSPRQRSPETPAKGGRSPSQVALNWVRQQQQKGVIIPIVGARTEAQMQDNLACLEFTLTEEQMQRLDDVSAINLGFPHNFLRSEDVTELIFGNMLPLIDNHRSYSLHRP